MIFLKNVNDRHEKDEGSELSGGYGMVVDGHVLPTVKTPRILGVTFD